MKQWRQIVYDEPTATQLAGKLGLPFSVAAVLAGRGIAEPHEAERFLRPRLSDLGDPFKIQGMTDAVEIILKAVDSGNSILIYGDYDADGVCGTALLAEVLEQIGARPRTFIPHRLNEGYGLSTNGIERFMAEEQPSLIVSVDCGTSSVNEIRRLRAAGTCVVVTDHHEASGAVAEPDALVNPRLGGAPAGTEWLAGVGVAFKLCHAILKRRREEGRNVGNADLKKWLDVVAVGTIADVVPLVGENRILVRHGLAQLAKEAGAGLAALMKVAGIRGELNAGQVAYWLAPRMNASGRMDDAAKSLELLRETDSGRAAALARALDENNRERRVVEESILKEADAQALRLMEDERSFGMVVSGTDWHPGTIGIVASRLASRYNRPTVVIGFDRDGLGRGSGRSIESVNLVKVLGECRELVSKYGGHAMAAGLEIERKNLEPFAELFNRKCAEVLEGVDLTPSLRIDASVELRELDEAFLDANNLIQPCGCGNPEPVYAAKGVKVLGAPRVLKDRHLKLLVGCGARQFEAIGFNMAGSRVPEGDVDIAFTVAENDFRGMSFLELRLLDIKVSEKEPLGSKP